MTKITMELSKRWNKIAYTIKLSLHDKYGPLGDIIPDHSTVGASPAHLTDLKASIHRPSCKPTWRQEEF